MFLDRSGLHRMAIDGRSSRFGAIWAGSDPAVGHTWIDFAVGFSCDLHIRKVVGATGFEATFAKATVARPATPCAQGKLERPLKVLIPERFAARENSWAQIWAHPRGDGAFLAATRGKLASKFVLECTSWDNGIDRAA